MTAHATLGPMSSVDDGNIVMALKDVVVHYPVKEGVLQRVVDFVRAVDGVSLTIPRGQTLGLVGESGCGKTTLGKVIAGLVPATSGEIWFNVTRQDLDELDRLQRSAQGELSKVERERLGQLQSKHRLGGMDKEAHRRYRRNCQVVFQDAFASLNPRQLVRDIVGRPLRVYHEVSGKDLDRQVVDLLDQVGLGAQHLLRYPHQFSGGQRQRISIARALALNPEFIVLDEPTSALDVSVQAQILNLLADLQKERNLTYLFITHDLGVVQHMADTIAVMYLGRIAETGPTAAVFNDPLHPYTRVLRESNPSLDGESDRDDRWRLSGAVPSPVDPPRGCRLHPRCPVAADDCGWQIDDVLHHVEEYNPSLFDSIGRVDRRDDFSAKVDMTSPEQACQLRDAVTELPAHAGLAEPIHVDGSVVQMTFKPVSDVEVMEVRPGRLTSCVRAQQTGMSPSIAARPEIKSTEGMSHASNSDT